MLPRTMSEGTQQAAAPDGASDEAKGMIRQRSQQICLLQDPKGLGTGVVLSQDGWILTNKHVAPSVGPYRVVLANGSNVHGVGVHQSVHHDLALVKIKGPVEHWWDLERDVLEDLVVGDEVFALGHPRGCRFSVSRGIISNPYREFDKEYFVQTDVAINPGNSGGPLVDVRGRLVGIVTMVLSGSQGMGFAVPGYTAADYARYARRLVRQGIVKVPESLLETAPSESGAEELVRRAVDELVGVGKASIEEEHPEKGTRKLKVKAGTLEVTVTPEVLLVTGRVATLGPAEKGNAKFLCKLLELNGTRELGGAAFTLAGNNEVHLAQVRSVVGLDALGAFSIIDRVAHLLEHWGPKMLELVLAEGSAASVTAGPGYPLLTLPTLPESR